MAFVQIPMFGSFQKGLIFRSEDPLEEVWDQIAGFGSKERLKNYSKSDNPQTNWNNFVDYIVPRIRQACEFRLALSQTSALTSPLLLYYSVLNLTRAALALVNEKETMRHGLVFVPGDTIFECKAKVTDGTFSELLLAV